MRVQVSIQVFDDKGEKVLGLSPSLVDCRTDQLRKTVEQMIAPTLWQFDNMAQQTK